MQLEFAAGTRWNYSNTGYLLLGVIAGKITGAPYWEALRTRIFTPAGMPTARINSEDDIVPHRAAGYRLVDGAVKHQEWVAPILNTTADGSLLLSLEDLVPWVRVVRERRVLSPESWRAALSPVRLTSGRTYPYGFGWSTGSRNGASVLQHGGSWQGFQTQVSLFFDPDISVIVLANSADADPGHIADLIAGAIDAKLAPPPLPTTARTDADPAVLRYVRGALEKTARGELSAGDFEFVRQTALPGMRRRYAELLQASGSIQQLELLQKGEEGDDATYVYRVQLSKRTLHAFVKIGPGGRLTGLSVRPID
jgi:CubicO group peptidase (beta-lactamase class C family)